MPTGKPHNKYKERIGDETTARKVKELERRDYWGPPHASWFSGNIGGVIKNEAIQNASR